MKRSKPQVAAVITIHGPGLMTLKGRRAIAHWMREQACRFQGYGSRYTKNRFTARYMY